MFTHFLRYTLIAALWLSLLFAATPVPMARAGDNGGSALVFDGADEHIRVNDDTSLSISTGELTIEAWVKLNDLGNYHSILMKGNYGYGFAIEQTTGKLGFWDQAAWSSVLKSSDSTTAGVWYHVAVTVKDNGSNLTINYYINGVADSGNPRTSSQADINNNSGQLAIGQQAPGNCNCNYFDGSMDEVRIWNKVRTQAEIQANMLKTLTPSSEANLVSYWKFDDGSGTTAADSKGSNDGTLQNMENADWVSSSAPIGDTTAGSQTNLAGMWAALTSATSSGLIIANSSFLNDTGDDIVFGHNGGTGTTTADLPAAVQPRWSRVWYLDKTDVNSNNGNVTLAFDFGDAGLGGTPSGTYHLLKRSGTSGTFASIATSSTVQNTDQIVFTVDAGSLGSYFTLGATATGTDPSASAPAASFNGSVTVTGGSAFYLNAFYGHVHVGIYGNHFGGAVKITSNGTTVCIEAPVGFEIIGASCYTDREGGRKDFFIRPIAQPAPTLITFNGVAVGASGGTFNLPSSGQLIIPPNLLANGSTLKLEPVANSTLNTPVGLRPLFRVVNAQIFNSAGTEIKSFTPPLQLCFSHTDSELASVGGDAKNFVILTSSDGKTLQELATTPDTTNKKVCANVIHFSLFELAARTPTTIPTTGEASLPMWLIAVALLGGAGVGWLIMRRNTN